MIAPRWLETKTQPIGIYDVKKYLIGCLITKVRLIAIMILDVMTSLHIKKCY